MQDNVPLQPDTDLQASSFDSSVSGPPAADSDVVDAATIELALGAGVTASHIRVIASPGNVDPVVEITDPMAAADWARRVVADIITGGDEIPDLVLPAGVAVATSPSGTKFLLGQQQPLGVEGLRVEALRAWLALCWLSGSSAGGLRCSLENAGRGTLGLPTRVLLPFVKDLPASASTVRVNGETHVVRLAGKDDQFQPTTIMSKYISQLSQAGLVRRGERVRKGGAGRPSMLFTGVTFPDGSAPIVGDLVYEHDSPQGMDTGMVAAWRIVGGRAVNEDHRTTPAKDIRDNPAWVRAMPADAMGARHFPDRATVMDKEAAHRLDFNSQYRSDDSDARAEPFEVRVPGSVLFRSGLLPHLGRDHIAALLYIGTRWSTDRDAPLRGGPLGRDAVVVNKLQLHRNGDNRGHFVTKEHLAALAGRIDERDLVLRGNGDPPVGISIDDIGSEIVVEPTG